MISAVVVAAGGTGLFLYENQLNKKNDIKTKAEQDTARLTTLRDQSSTEVRRLLDDGKFQDAQKAIEEWRNRGISAEQSINLETQVSASVREERSKLLEKANDLVTKKDVANAKKVEQEIRLLDRSMGTGDERSERLAENIRDLEKKLESEAAASALDKCRKAIEAKDWDQAKDLLDRARATSLDRSLIRSAEEDLQNGVGGRLRVTGKPTSAKIRVAGRPPVKMGEIVSGLPQGEVEIKITAPGYIPVKRIVVVRYPQVREEVVELLRQSPSSLWAVKSLAGLCGQSIAVEYYRRKVTDRVVLDAISELVQPCPVQAQEDGPRSRRKKNVEYLVETIFKNKDKLTNVVVLNELGTLVAERPEALAIIMKNKAGSIKRFLKEIEKGCLGCQGSGIMVCHDCNGTKKRRESRECKKCHGQGKTKCPTCFGKRKIICRSCHGRGYRVEEVVDPGKDGIVTPRVVKIRCSTCLGNKKVPCTNPNCDMKGLAPCPTCKGDKSLSTIGDCSTCQVQGGSPCTLCSGRKSKADMPRDNRREAEQELAELLARMSATNGG